MSKPLPTSTSTFEDIIQGDYLYIDKTQDIYQIVQNTKGAFFLSRPRRFGKSLMVSTLKKLFQGNRELFRGLWIEESDYDWEPHPVIHLNFSLYPSKTVTELEENIKRYLRYCARENGVTLPDGPHYAQFGDLIFELSAKNQVVILIDEYDKPIIDHLTDPKQAEEMREVLKGFYAVVKAMEEHIRMVFITGISKFSKVNIFSELNHLSDLTLDERFATTLGITQNELTHYFEDRLPAFAKKEGLTVDELIEKIRYWYDGFRFTRVDESLYNPFSTMNLFDKMSFHNFWFESATPSFLIKLLHQQNYDMEQMDHLEISELAFSTYDIEDLSVIPLLFQTGYLTIKDYNPTTDLYTLDYPNHEVANAFVIYLLDAFSNIQQGLSETHLVHLIQALQGHDLEHFFEIMQVLFANIDYDLTLNYEKYYQTIFYLIFKLIGLRIDAEVKTNIGRIDAVVELPDHIYIFEFKLDKSAEEALKQIRTQTYFQKYQLHGKQITCIGANFNTQTRSIDKWDSEVVDPI